MGMLVGGISVDIPPHQCKAGAQVWRRPVGRPPARRRLRRGGDPCGGTQTHDPALVPPAYNNTPNKAFLRRRAPDPPPRKWEPLPAKIATPGGEGGQPLPAKLAAVPERLLVGNHPQPSSIEPSFIHNKSCGKARKGYWLAPSCQLPGTSAWTPLSFNTRYEGTAGPARTHPPARAPLCRSRPNPRGLDTVLNGRPSKIRE